MPPLLISISGEFQLLSEHPKDGVRALGVSGLFGVLGVEALGS